MRFIRKFIKEAPSWRLIAFVGIVVFAVLALWTSLFRDFDHDEFEAIHSAWLLFSGQTIYVDFFQHHHFLFYYSLAPVFAVFGEGVDAIMAARFLSLAITAGIIFLTYRIALMTYGRDVAILSVFFLMTTFMFLDKAVEVRPDVPLVLFELLSALFFLKYLQSKRLWYLSASAAALFVAFLFLQKAVFLGMLVGAVFLYSLYRKEFSWREFATYLGPFAMLLGGFLWYVSLTFGWSEYFFLNWKLNTQLLNTFPIYKYLLRSMAQNPLLWVLFFSGIFIMLQKRTFDVMAFFALGLLGSIFLTKSPFPQYYMMSLPFMAIVAAVFFAKLRERQEKLALTLMVLTTIWAAGSIWYMWKNNETQLAKVAYVLSVTDPDDFVYDGDAQFNVFRKDIDYFWYSLKPKTGNLTAYRSMREYEYDTYQLIDEKKPKVVSNSFIKTKDPAIADHYIKSKVFSDLFIRNDE